MVLTAESQTINEYAFCADVAAVDWDLRVHDNVVRIFGPAAVSREQDMLLTQFVWEVSENGRMLVHEEPPAAHSLLYTYAAALQFEQLNRSWNLYGGLAIADADFSVGSYGRDGLTDRLVTYSDVNHSATSFSTLFHNLHLTSELTQHLLLGGFRQLETLVTGYAAILTRSFNQILLSMRASRRTGSQWWVAADVAGSTDLRSSWIFRPQAAMSTTGSGAFPWHLSAAATVRVGSAVSVDVVTGLEGCSSEESGRDKAAYVPRHLSSARLSGNGSMVLSAYDDVWQAYPWVGYSLAALNPFGISYVRDMPYRFAFTRAGTTIVISVRIDLEVGAVLRVSGNQGASGHSGFLSGGAADFYLRLGWEYKASSRLEFGLITSGNSSRSLIRPGAAWCTCTRSRFHFRRSGYICLESRARSGGRPQILWPVSGTVVGRSLTDIAQRPTALAGHQAKYGQSLRIFLVGQLKLTRPQL